MTMTANSDGDGRWWPRQIENSRFLHTTAHVSTVSNTNRSNNQTAGDVPNVPAGLDDRVEGDGDVEQREVREHDVERCAETNGNGELPVDRGRQARHVLARRAAAAAIDDPRERHLDEHVDTRHGGRERVAAVVPDAQEPLVEERHADAHGVPEHDPDAHVERVQRDAEVDAQAAGQRQSSSAGQLEPQQVHGREPQHQRNGQHP